MKNTDPAYEIEGGHSGIRITVKLPNDRGYREDASAHYFTNWTDARDWLDVQFSVVFATEARP